MSYLSAGADFDPTTKEDNKTVIKGNNGHFYIDRNDVSLPKGRYFI